MTTGKALDGKPYAGNPHVRFDKRDVASTATPRRGSLLYKTIAMMLGAGALLPLHADTYQFIVSGYPAANESYAAASAATSLETATRSGWSAASALEARYRTWDESDGIALRSDKYRGMMIIIR